MYILYFLRDHKGLLHKKRGHKSNPASLCKELIVANLPVTFCYLHIPRCTCQLGMPTANLPSKPPK